MVLDVLCQVIGPRKSLVAVLALVRPRARVAPLVPPKLVGSREGPLAAAPFARVRLLASVPPDVCFEVR